MAKTRKEKKRYTSIGGQALMEGIMMRGPYKTVMCVRRADGSIVTESMPTSSPTIWNKIPLLRGIISLVQSMSLGTKLLMRSAEIAIEDELKAGEEALKTDGNKTGTADEVCEESVGETAEETETPEAAAGSDEESAGSAGSDEKTADDAAKEVINGAENTAGENDDRTEKTDEEAVDNAEETDEEAVDNAEETGEEAVDNAEETGEEAVDNAEKTGEEAVDNAEKTDEEAVDSSEKTSEDTSGETIEITEDTAEKDADTEQKRTEENIAASETAEKSGEDTVENDKSSPSAGRKAVAVIGSILCLALGVYLFFFAAPEIVSRLVGDILPGVLPQRFAESLAASPDKWLLGTSIAVKLIILLVLFGLVSLAIGSEKSGNTDKNAESKKSLAEESGPLVVISTILGFGMAILLFSYAPTWIASAMFKWVFPYVLPAKTADYMALQTSQNIWRPIIEGVIKVLILVVYMALISKMDEIHTLFQYHGAEHKTIACYEAGEELNPENVRKYKRFHPRCGTSFLILMLLVGIIVGMAAKYLLPPDIANSNLWYPLIKVGLIPLIMGVGYELLKMCGRHDNIITRIIAAPGLLMQRITTKEPTDAMIECAIAAIKPVIPENGEDML